MRPSLSLSLAAAGATAAALAASPAAYAADAVYGGSSPGGDPIVLKTDAKAKQLRSVVISWRAVCGDGDWFPGAGTLTPVKPVAGFSPNSSELLVSQNGKGRFKGTQLGGFVSGTSTAAIQVQL